MRPRPDRILDYREFPILYVDDEPENLRVFELTYRREFSVVTAESAEEGLEKLQAEPVALVLSDHRMPGMSGVDFLSRALEVDPKTVRMLVTAYGDAQTLGTAINSGAIYKFIPKPWQPDEMRVALRRGIETYALDREREQLVRELTLLNRVAKSITQELDIDPLLDLILATVTTELGYDGAAMLFFDRAEESLGRGRFAPADSPVCESLASLTMNDQNAPAFLRRVREGEVQELSADEAFELEEPVRHWVTEVAADRILVVPLMGRERVVGVLAVDNRSGGRRFNGDDQTLLEGLSHQVVIAIENARLVEDLRRSREHVRRVDRLGTLGTMAAGLAHEINNPLVSIHTFLAMAPEKLHDPEDEFWGDYHALASREVDRIRRLVETMRSLGRDNGVRPPRELFDPVKLAREVISLVDREAGRAKVTIALEDEPGLPKLLAVRDHMHQVFLNLLLNALHATPPGGRVEVRIQRDPGGEALCVEIRDSGAGIPEEDLSRIFDPFFTTKDPDTGTGLGLMICHRLVSDHDGSIEVSSREGEGSCFCVRLPIGGDLGAPGGALEAQKSDG